MNKLISFLQRLRGQAPHLPLLQGEAFHRPIHAFLQSSLEPHGFIEIRPGKWVEREADPIRKVFEIRFVKGACAFPTWGISLNFVPHLNNNRTDVYWHRTPKTARIDVAPPPPALPIDKRPVLEQFMHPEDHERQVRHVLSMATRLAFEYYKKLSCPETLLLELDQWSDCVDDNWYWHHENLPIANAFWLRVGRTLYDRSELLD
jgi:hypothetical protein